MAQQTHMQAFTDSVAQLIIDYLVDPVVMYMKDKPKDEEVTRDKILSCLKVPIPVSTQTVSRSSQRISSTTQPLSQGSNGSRTRRSTKATSERPQCQWKFTRGVKTGTLCTSPAAEDSIYCSACKTKKGAGGSGRKPSTTGEKPASTKPTKGNGKQPGLSVSTEESEDSTYEIDPSEFGETEDGCRLLLDKGSNFIIKVEDEDNEIYKIVGYNDDSSPGKMRALKPADKAKAKELGLDIDFEDGVKKAK